MISLAEVAPSMAKFDLAGTLTELYRQMLLIRQVEDRLSGLFAEGAVPGFIHLSIGQEAVSVGVMQHLTGDDTIASTHRGHGHAIAKGLPLLGFFAELLGRNTGLCKGRSGSMHVADLSLGMLGANGIVGAGIPIALGSALAHRALGHRSIAVALFGDGALAEGVLHESFNIAKLWQLPVLFVCENNGWSEFSLSQSQLAFTLQSLCPAYQIPYLRADGNDVTDVSELAEGAIARIRADAGPIVLECFTDRARGHYEGDAQKYRDKVAMAAIAQRDPVQLAAARLLELGVPQSLLDNILRVIEAQIGEALAQALKSEPENFARAVADVYGVTESL
jgi:pyruvate dehydrogenase E1 component alpha subunit